MDALVCDVIYGVTTSGTSFLSVVNPFIEEFQMARYNRNQSNIQSEKAKAYFNITMTMPSGAKVKTDGKSFMESFDSHHEAIEFAKANHNKTFTFGPMQLHVWYVEEMDPNAPVKTSWEGITADGEEVPEEGVPADVIDAVAADVAAAEDDSPF